MNFILIINIYISSKIFKIDKELFNERGKRKFKKFIYFKKKAINSLKNIFFEVKNIIMNNFK